jgi:hypothetical protein
MERQGIHIHWLDGQDSPEVNVKKISRPDHQGNE